MRFVVASIALALLIGCGGAEEEAVARPLRLVASDDQSGLVRLDWSMGPGADPVHLLVLRDREIVAELPPGTRSFEDSSAAAPEWGVSDLVADPVAIGVALSWTVAEAPGMSHSYVVRAVGSGGKNRDSEPATGARSIPIGEGFTVLRDGEVLAELQVEARAFHDKESAAGPAPALRAVGTPSSVDLEWDEIAPSSTRRYAYEVRGRGADGTVTTAGPIEVESNPAQPDEFLLYRDGELLAGLSVDIHSFRDDSATPGRVVSLGLGIRSETVHAVDLMWSAPVITPGPAHRYELGVRWEGENLSRSEAVVAGRQTPVVSVFEVRRDGEPIARIPGDRTGFRDESAEAGVLTLTAFRAEGSEEGVGLSWSIAPGRRGRLHSYQVEVVPNEGQDASSNEVKGSRTAPNVLGFLLSRDGEPIASLDALQRDFVDQGAGPAIGFGSPLLAAGLTSVTNTDGVWLRWTEPPGEGTAHQYELEVVSEVGPEVPSTTAGARRPSPSGYELQRDDGPWVAIQGEPLEDGLLGYMDRDAPFGALRVAVTVDTHPVLWDAFFRSEIEVTPPTPSLYRVRAIVGDVAGFPSDVATAARRVGDVFTYQWQRSNSGQEADYFDLPFQTLSAGFDESTPEETTRYYRVKVRTAGAEGTSPAVLAEAETFDQIAAFNEFNCGIRSSDGKRRCWGGSDASGQAPIESSEDAFDHIALGESFGCGIRRGDGKRVCWGNNSLGQAPPAPSEASYRFLDGSYGYACGIREADGRIDCWGSLQYGQAPPTTMTDSFMSLSTGMYHMCAIREEDHKVFCWGDNGFGRAPPGPSENSFLQITSGKQATCGVRLSDHKVLCWGNGLYGEAPPGPSPVAYESVAAGDMHTCGVRLEDGHVQCWGIDDNCESSNYQVSLYPFSQVAGGFNHSCGILRDDGRVVCWGLNRSGQAPRAFPAFPEAFCVR